MSPLRSKRVHVVVGMTLVLTATGVAVTGSPASAAAGVTTRVSSTSAGVAGTGPSDDSWATSGGRYVGFSSEASNLVPGDTNFAEDVFLRDRSAGTTERISVATDGTQGVYPSVRPRISADGRYVVFESLSPNLVPADTNGRTDIFLRDRQSRTTVRLSVAANGTQAAGTSTNESISPDGRFVTVTSDAPNLVPGDTNGLSDVFLLDRRTGGLTLVSTNQAGQQGNSSSDSGIVSADGRYVVFESGASNLVPGDTNDVLDIFVKDMQTGAVRRVSVSNAGTQLAEGGSTPSVSEDGRYVTFIGQPMSEDSQVYVRDLTLRKTTLVSVGADGRPGDFGAYGATISGNGRYVAFTSGATTIVPGSPPFFNSYVRDLTTGVTTLVSLTYTGVPIMESTGDPQATNAGVAFTSFADNVVADTNGRTEQIYFHPL